MKLRQIFSSTFSNWPVKILSVAAALLLFVFNRMNNLENHSIEATLLVKLSEEHAISAPETLYEDKIKITIRGDKKLDITQLTEDDFIVKADLRKVTDISKPITVPIGWAKTGDATEIEPIDVSLMPPEVTITLEKRVEKTVNTVDNVVGNLPTGFILSDKRLVPGQVTITGAESRVKRIHNIKTETISLANRKQDFFTIVKPVIPEPFVTTKDVLNFEFTAYISEIITEQVFTNVQMNCKNISREIVLGNELPMGTIRLRVAQNVLKSLTPGAISMEIDCSNIKRAGKYTLRIIPIVPKNTIIVYYEPKEILIDFIPGA